MTEFLQVNSKFHTFELTLEFVAEKQKFFNVSWLDWLLLSFINVVLERNEVILVLNCSMKHLFLQKYYNKRCQMVYVPIWMACNLACIDWQGQMSLELWRISGSRKTLKRFPKYKNKHLHLT